MKLYAWTAILSLCGLCTCASELQYTRSVEVPNLSIPRRAKTIKPAVLYPEVQYKYGYFQNFLDFYVDRPLFFNRAYRGKNFSYMTEDSFFHDIQVAKSYGFDGTGSLCDGIYNLFTEINKYLKNSPERAPGHREFLQFALFNPHPAQRQKQLERCRKILKTALASPFFYRVNGKFPISTYCGYRLPPEEVKKFIATLKQEFGDVFYLTCELVINYSDCLEFYQTGKWSPATQQKYRKKLHQLLTVWDGVQISTETNRRSFDYVTHPDFGIYDQYIEPLIRECQRDVRFKNKLYGSGIRQGYLNHMSGVNHGEFGTQRLRGTMERILKLDPDFIFFLEWNEFNENTCFQPTLRNSLALQRLFKFYTATLHRKPLTPNPGDDLNLPPLILSNREAARVSEVVTFELLNVPDTTQSASYQATLELQDLHGRVLATLPQEHFDRAQFKTISYRVPMVQFSTQTVIRPVLKVTDRQGQIRTFDQLQSVRLHPTICKVYQENHQGLRDLITPEKVQFTTQSLPAQRYRIQAQMVASEPLAAVEILDHGREIYALDPDQEFDRTKNIIVQGIFSTRTRVKKLRQCKIQVTNAPGWKFQTWELPNVSFGKWQRHGDTIVSRSHIWASKNMVTLTIPRAAVPQAVLNCEVAGEKMSIPVAQLVKQTKYSPDFTNLRVDWQIYNFLPDLPRQLGTKQAKLDITVSSDYRYPLFQLRAVTQSGKIYRSALRMPCPLPAATQKLNVYNETNGKIVTVPVRSSLIPQLQYRFSPECGNVLRNTFHPYFDAGLGGGFYYGQVAERIPLPPRTNFAPRWQKTPDGTYQLKFSGINFLNFPQETFPRGNFTLKMELKAENPAPVYVLFRHFNEILGSVTLFVKYDKLYLSYGDHQVKTHIFPTNLPIEPGKWSKIAVTYDYQTLQFKVNGQVKRYPIAEPLVPLYFKSAMWGGHTKPEFGLPDKAQYFSGLLRNLEISHDAQF